MTTPAITPVLTPELSVVVVLMAGADVIVWTSTAFEGGLSNASMSAVTATSVTTVAGWTEVGTVFVPFSAPRQS